LTIGNGRARTPVLLVAAAAVMASLAFLSAPTLFVAWDHRAVDAMFRLRDRWPRFRPPFDDSLVHVDFNDSSRQSLGLTDLTRAHYAQATDALSRMGAAAIVFDFVFATPTEPSDDARLANAMARAGNVFFGLAFRLPRDSPAPVELSPSSLRAGAWPLQAAEHPWIPRAVNGLAVHGPLARASHGLGFLNLHQDLDGVFRRIPLLLTYRGQVYPSLALAVACHRLGVRPEGIAVAPGSITLHRPATATQAPAHVRIPVDAAGHMIVNFARAWEELPHANFSDVVTLMQVNASDDEWRDWQRELGGRIALVSDVTSGGGETGATPTDPYAPLSSVHSHAINTIVSQAFLREASVPAILLLEGTAFLVLVAAAAGSGRVWPAAIPLLSGYLGVVVLAFLVYNVIFPIVRPVMFITAGTLAVAMYRFTREARDRAVLRRTFEAYFPPAIVDRLVRHPELLSLSQQKELTVLFSDIVGFTARAGGMRPDEVQRFLNAYFDSMVEVAFAYGGTVDKFIGDGLLVFFNDPEPQADHARRAVRCALAMHDAVKTVAAGAHEPLHIRIGVATGAVVVGNMGSARRLSYTVLGANVNLAQRLESAAPPGGILASAGTYEQLGVDRELFAPVTVRLKGWDQPVEVYAYPARSETTEVPG
jgi:adenylate cyclase